MNFKMCEVNAIKNGTMYWIIIMTNQLRLIKKIELNNKGIRYIDFHKFFDNRNLILIKFDYTKK
jgi:hypothetical protein